MKQLLALTVVILITSCSNPFGGVSPGGRQEVLFDHTILVYANGDNSLEKDIIADIQEWEYVQSSKDNIKVVILLDRAKGYSTILDDWSDSRAYELAPDSSFTSIGSKAISIPELDIVPGRQTELNMGNPDTLSSFITFGKRVYPAHTYSLIVAGHGDGWFIDPARGVSSDSSSGSELSPIDLVEALNGNPIHILSLDACSMGGAEVIVQLAGFADYVIASPTKIPESSYNNSTLYKMLLETDPLDKKAIATAFVSAFAASGFTGGSNMFAYDPVLLSKAVHSSDFISWVSDLISAPENMNSISDANRYWVEGRQSYVDMLALSACPASVAQAAITAAGIEPSLAVYFPFNAGDLDYTYFDALSFQSSTSWQDLIKAYHSIP